MALRYATAADLEHRLTTLRITALSGNDHTVEEDCIIMGADLFDSYAGSRYAVPLAAPIPGIVNTQVLTLAAYNLASRLGAVDDRLRLDYEDVILWLKDLSNGKVSLAISPPPTAAVVNATYFVSATPTRKRTSFSGV